MLPSRAHLVRADDRRGKPPRRHQDGRRDDLALLLPWLVPSLLQFSTPPRPLPLSPGLSSSMGVHPVKVLVNSVAVLLHSQVEQACALRRALRTLLPPLSRKGMVGEEGEAIRASAGVIRLGPRWQRSSRSVGRRQVTFARRARRTRLPRFDGRMHEASRDARDGPGNREVLCHPNSTEVLLAYLEGRKHRCHRAQPPSCAPMRAGPSTQRTVPASNKAHGHKNRQSSSLYFHRTCPTERRLGIWW